MSARSRGTVVGNVVYCDGVTDPKMEGPGTWASQCQTWDAMCTAGNTCNVCYSGNCTTYNNQGC